MCEIRLPHIKTKKANENKKMLNLKSYTPDIKIIEHLLYVLKRQVRNRYPPPSTLKELEKVLIKE